ncbi:MAG: SAVED domain-containing protein [Caldilineaceae bacterium]|nr:SAVED domain-containing protein [Caldilineaceae bacterium]
MTTRLSASGARIRGDDYQHLFAWLQVIRAIQVESGIAEIGIEDPEAGNADDVTVYTEDQKHEYYQVKSSVDARETIGLEWLMKPSRAGGQSVVQRFHSLWADGPKQCKPKLFLVTNRLATHGDPILRMIDGRNRTVARSLRLADSNSGAGIARKELSEHLQISEKEVLFFLESLCFQLGKSDYDWIEMAKPFMYAASLRHDEEAVAQGVGIVRGWVTAGKRKLTTAELRRAVEPLKRTDDLPAASLLVQAIDRDPMPEVATIALDWASLFPGSEPRVRRQPSDQSLWNDRFRPELQKAAKDFRALGHNNVLVRGYMRLPTWFATGVELGKTADFQVTSFQDQAPWSSKGALSAIAIERIDTNLGNGDDLAIGIALAFDLSTDVLAYLHEQQINVGRYVCLRPAGGANNQAIRNAAEARQWAYAVRDLIRHLVQEYRPSRIHLFLAGPHSAILLLGHLWDRMPDTQLYEDLGSTKGYNPSYLIPN